MEWKFTTAKFEKQGEPKQMLIPAVNQGLESMPMSVATLIIYEW